jgi:hypothetical protein
VLPAAVGASAADSWTAPAASFSAPGSTLYAPGASLMLTSVAYFHGAGCRFAGIVGEFVPGGTLLADACTDLFRTCGACAAPVAARLAPPAGSPAVPFSCRAPADAWPAPSLSLAEPSVRRPVTRL